MREDLEQLTRRLKDREPTMMDANGRYAVLVPVVDGKDGPSLLYEVRASVMRRQPGEVCFPGGKVEPGETVEQCALRETWEELGIPADQIQVLGRLDFITHRANFIMYPVLARVSTEAVSHMTLNPDEVGEVFRVPLEYLITHPPAEYHYDLIPKPEKDFPYDFVGIPRDYNWQKGGETISVYPWQQHTIWGLTGRITRHLVKLLTHGT